MSQSLPMAPHEEMDRRSHLAYEFYEATGAEIVPFVSDEATWYAFDYLDDDELVTAVRAHYGVVLDKATIKLPFWRLLDFLDLNRVRTDDSD